MFQKIKKVQKSGPYVVSGYSFGACVAFELALLLEAAKENVSLVLLDGSPNYVSRYTGNFKARQKSDNQYDASALTYFISLFMEGVYNQKVSYVISFAVLRFTSLD